MKKEKQEKPVVISVVDGTRMEQITLHLVGTNPLIQKKITNDTIEDLQRKAEKMPPIKRLPKTEKQMFEESPYRIGKKFGHPAAGFKGSIVEGNRDSKAHSKRVISKWFFIIGDPVSGLVPLNGVPVCRTDTFRMRNGLGRTTRAIYHSWSADLVVQFDASKLTVEQLIQFVNTAGAISGIGCWRPSAPKTPGDYGRYKVISTSNHKNVN